MPMKILPTPGNSAKPWGRCSAPPSTIASISRSTDHLFIGENKSMRLTRKLPSGRSCIQFGRLAVVPSLLIAAALAVVPAARAQTSPDGLYAVTYLDVGTTSVAQGAEFIKKFRDEIG